MGKKEKRTCSFLVIPSTNVTCIRDAHSDCPEDKCITHCTSCFSKGTPKPPSPDGGGGKTYIWLTGTAAFLDILSRLPEILDIIRIIIEKCASETKRELKSSNNINSILTNLDASKTEIREAEKFSRTLNEQERYKYLLNVIHNIDIKINISIEFLNDNGVSLENIEKIYIHKLNQKDLSRQSIEESLLNELKDLPVTQQHDLVRELYQIEIQERHFIQS